MIFNVKRCVFMRFTANSLDWYSNTFVEWFLFSIFYSYLNSFINNGIQDALDIFNIISERR